MVAVSAHPYGGGDVTCGDLFGRRLVAAPLPTHTPTECGRATLPSVGRRYIFSLVAGLPTYVRTRAKMSSRDVAVPLLVPCRACIHIRLHYVGVGTQRACVREAASAGSLSRTLNQSDRFSIYGLS